MVGRVAGGLLGTTIYGIGLTTLLVSEATESTRGTVAMVLLALQVLRIVFRGYSNSLTIVFSATTVLLYAIPGSAIVILKELDVLPAVLLYIVFTDAMLSISLKDRGQFQEPLKRSIVWSRIIILRIIFYLLLVWCAVAGFFLELDGFLSLIVFVAPYSVSLVFFERLLAHKASLLFIFCGLAAYIALIAVYVAFHWSGFGRLIVGAFALAPFLVANCHRDFGLRTSALVLVAPIALYFAQLSRYGSLNKADDFFIGSAGHHLLVTNDVFIGGFNRNFGGWDVFVSQYALLFFNWAPRSWWPEKPLGAGLWSVDVVYGREGYGEGYSQSLGFLGELYLYLGSDFWIGALIVFVTLLLFRRAVARFSYGFAAPLVVFDVNLISYFWGGMATFGSRFWFMVLPAIAVCWIFNRGRER